MALLKRRLLAKLKNGTGGASRAAACMARPLAEGPAARLAPPPSREALAPSCARPPFQHELPDRASACSLPLACTAWPYRPGPAASPVGVQCAPLVIVTGRRGRPHRYPPPSDPQGLGTDSPSPPFPLFLSLPIEAAPRVLQDGEPSR